jgi:hypothetical protein
MVNRIIGICYPIRNVYSELTAGSFQASYGGCGLVPQGRLKVAHRFIDGKENKPFIYPLNSITTLRCLELECIHCVDAADASQRWI